MVRLTRAALDEARERITPHVHRTPLLSFRTLGDHLGTRLLLKCENLQKTGSFKVRGALNSVALLSDVERARGVVTISAGNHAQAVAWAGARLGAAATVVMPAGASPTKVEATRGYGARVVLHGTAAEAFREAFRIADEEELTFLHPFDAEPVIAGHGSTALEIGEDLEGPVSIVVPVGGGGQIAGIAAAASHLEGYRVFGVEPRGADAMRRSLDAGHAVTLDRTDTIADGLAPPMAGDLTYAYVSELVEDVVTVSDDEILAAMGLIMRRARLVVEPSGAAAVAGLMTGRIPVQSGESVVAVLSGGNAEPSLIERALEAATSWP